MILIFIRRILDSIETQYMPNDINMYGAKAQSILEADTLFTSKTSFQIHEK